MITLVALTTLLAGMGLGVILGLSTVQREASQTITVSQSTDLVTDPTPYFPAGYDSKTVNFSNASNGDLITAGKIDFRLVIPSNIETRTTTIGGSKTTITITADYQCGISFGRRIFFDALFSNNVTVRLDYCLILNNAIQVMLHTHNMSAAWSLWQISLNTSPTVALHMMGSGERVTLVELIISAYNATASESISTSDFYHTSMSYPGSFDTVCRSEGYATAVTFTTNTSNSTTFVRSSGTAGSRPINLLGSSGTMSLSGTGNFYFFRMNDSTSETFQFMGVDFNQQLNYTNTPTSNANTVCYPTSTTRGYQVTFEDGTRQNVSSCITSQQGTWELHLTTHVPTAGLLILSDGNIYYLVNMQ